MSGRRNLLPKSQFFQANPLPNNDIGGQGNIRIKCPHPDVTNVDLEDEDETGDNKEIADRGNANQISAATGTPLNEGGRAHSNNGKNGENTLSSTLLDSHRTTLRPDMKASVTEWRKETT